MFVTIFAPDDYRVALTGAQVQVDAGDWQAAIDLQAATATHLLAAAAVTGARRDHLNMAAETEGA